VPGAAGGKVSQRELFVDAPPVYTVTQINERVRTLLDRGFATVHVEGEISNSRRQSTGHWYLTLKDATSQLSVVLFRSDAQALRFQIEDGLRVRAGGRLTLYMPQGRYQLQARTILPVGVGPLELAFQQLKERLEREGLFDPARKRALPRFPRRIALITSPTGAVIRDMLSTLRARWPFVHVRVVPVAVQGDFAAAEIAAALRFVNRVAAADVIVVARGGGSLEDLWAFNEEPVARAIVASRIPVVSAVGHETDYTIADFVADVRASTPTAAAQLVVPDRREVRAQVHTATVHMGRSLQRKCEVARHRLAAMQRSYGMRRPGLLIDELRQSVDTKLSGAERALRTQMRRSTDRVVALQGRLQALGPRNVLARGYAYCVDARDRRVVSRAAAAFAGQELDVHFADGALRTRVESAAAPTRPEGGDRP
jgi:exodeoxyribonuclease VII large subunit